MKFIKSLLISFFIIGMSNTSNAQFWKKIQKKIEKKIEQKVEQKIDKETDKAIDKTLEGKTEKAIDTEKSKENYLSSYSFTKSIVVEVTNKKDINQQMEFLMGNYEDTYGILMLTNEMNEQGEVIVVVSPKSTVSFMNVSGMKIKNSTSMNKLGKGMDMSNKMPDSKDFSFKKTGKTKKILGYTCEEYKVDYNFEKDKGTANCWVANDFPIKNKELPMLGMRKDNPYFSGFVLEINSTTKGEDWTVRVVNVSDKTKIIRTDEYKTMGF